MLSKSTLRTVLVLGAPLGLLACDMGPSDVSVIEDVQILHAGTPVPVILPGTTLDFTVTVADPTGGGVELLAWACTGFDGTCLEAELLSPDARMVVVDAVDEGDFGEDATVSLEAPAALAGLGQGDTALPFEPFGGVWFLACEPGLCPWIQQARDALAAGSIGAELEGFLGDPTAALAGIPATGSSLAQRRLPIYLGEGEVDANPELRLAEEVELTVSTEAEVALDFEWIDESPGTVELQSFATVGAMGPFRAYFEEPLITWFAGEEAGEGRLYVVARDEASGTALWRQDATVQE